MLQGFQENETFGNGGHPDGEQEPCSLSALRARHLGPASPARPRCHPDRRRGTRGAATSLGCAGPGPLDRTTDRLPSRCLLPNADGGAVASAAGLRRRVVGRAEVASPAPDPAPVRLDGRAGSHDVRPLVATVRDGAHPGPRRTGLASGSGPVAVDAGPPGGHGGGGLHGDPALRAEAGRGRGGLQPQEAGTAQSPPAGGVPPGDRGPGGSPRWRPGSANTATGAVEWILELMEGPREAGVQEVTLRADKGFFSKELPCRLDRLGIPCFLKAPNHR